RIDVEAFGVGHGVAGVDDLDQRVVRGRAEPLRVDQDRAAFLNCRVRRGVARCHDQPHGHPDHPETHLTVQPAHSLSPFVPGETTTALSNWLSGSLLLTASSI